MKKRITAILLGIGIAYTMILPTTVVCATDQKQTETEVSCSLEAAEDLYFLKADKLSEALTADMLIELTELGYLPLTGGFMDEKELEKEAPELEITFYDKSGEIAVEDPHKVDYSMCTAGNILLALIKDLNKVTFTYRLENGEEYHLYWDQKSAKEEVGEDIKTYIESAQKFETLFEELTLPDEK